MDSPLKSFTARLALCAILFAMPVFARSVRGVVMDNAGKPVTKASVRLKNRATLRVRSARTGADGVYRLTGLNPRMDYELRAAYKGLSSGWVSLSRFDEGDERTIDLRLR